MEEKPSGKSARIAFGAVLIASPECPYLGFKQL